jgi:c(7)-type cytochrome triheme protein
VRALVVIMLLAGVASAEAPFGFDHVIHARDVDVKGKQAIDCTHCHAEKQGKLVGKPTHATCFGQCHGPLPAKPARGAKIAAGDRTRLCQSCHSDAQLASKFTGKLPASYPPYTLDPDFSITFGHKLHTAVTCASCHDVRDKAKKAPVHSRCAGCHDGSGAQGRGPAMTKCTSCHPAGVGKLQPPELAVVKDSVESSFSHAKHAGRGPLGKDCGTCHGAIRETDDSQLPRPTVKSCAVSGCHDTKAAFPTTAACSRCHDRTPTERFEVHRPTTRFSHRGDHEQLVKSTTCVTCHPLLPSGEVRVVGHGPCVECHTDDFGARKPLICGACHNGTEPWRKLVADRAPPSQTEFGASLDHAKHKADCATCHTLRTGSSELRTSRGHHACTGKGCHENKGGPTPSLTECASCHRIGLSMERITTRLKAPWSVRDSFQHATHRTTQNGNELSCTSCHSDLKGNDLLALPTPKKAACVLCHDTNKQAFKVTGTDCKRCHGVAQ